jgi:hypothetical protein
LLAASLAHAQAPGDVAPQVIVAPVIAPVIVSPAPAAAPAPVVAPAPVIAPAIAPAPTTTVICGGGGGESVMANRWALGFSLGSMSLAPDAAPDDKTAFAVGELALRFRATPHIELELTVGGGRERTPDNQDGDLAVSTGLLAARYRFRPEAAWNWFVMGGFGGAAVTRHDATDQERHDATQPLGMLGVGVERRFRHFAIQAEARAIGIGNKPRDETMPASAPAASGAIDPTAMSTTAAPPAIDEKRAGGSLSVGLSYYF